ncbi:MAG TPA: VUT family protein, partial [Thermomonas sp.]|nr:VUT family protein [Thermomonas sp.]
VGTLNYAYKMLAAIALIPLLYLMRAGIHRYLGKERAAQLRQDAALRLGAR